MLRDLVSKYRRKKRIIISGAVGLGSTLTAEFSRASSTDTTIGLIAAKYTPVSQSSLVTRSSDMLGEMKYTGTRVLGNM